MNIFFFRRPKPRQFTYIPRYYDPVKEEMVERKKQLGLIQESDPGERMRSEIRRKWKTDRGPVSRGPMMMRVIIYVIFAGFAIYFIFFTNFINTLVSLFVR